MNQAFAVTLATVALMLPAAAATAPKPAWIHEAKHDLSPPLSSVVRTRPGVPPKPDADPSPAGVDPSIGLNFDGIAAAGWLVPDTNGAVGATQFVEWVNTRYSIYDKASGALLMGPTNGNTLWSGFGGPCQTQNSGDVLVNYDKLAGRWVFTQHATPIGGPYYQCVAVSTTSDARGTYNRYAFQLTGSNFPDYPKLAVWPDAYYITSDEVNSASQLVDSAVCALDRTNMLAGNAATAVCFHTASASQFSLLPADVDGLTAPPAGAKNYLAGLGTNAINWYTFHVDFTNPANSTFTGPVSVPVTSFTQACNGSTCIPQPGTSQQLDSLGDRLLYRLAYRNFGDHESLVVSHAVKASTGNTAIRWYELRSPSATKPTVFQQGTYNPTVAYRWMPSIAMDKLGDIAVGYSLSSSASKPSLRYAGRHVGDALNTMGTEVSIVFGTGVETGTFRWGDYASMTVDPTDDCTFWFTGQYLTTNGNKNWRTRLTSIKFSACH